MSKASNPAKIIKQRARKLPLHKCLVSKDWEESGLPNVMVSRKHANGHYTVGFYLVDLLCLGVKDTHFRFNIAEHEFEDLLDTAINKAEMMEVDYNLAHNIVFAGYEFALDFGFKAHKDFEKTTKFILEKDDENVPLIDIECGADGTPHYFQTELDNATYAGKVIRALDKNLGEGNYHVTRLADQQMENGTDENEETPNDIDKTNLDFRKAAIKLFSYLDQEELSEDEEQEFDGLVEALTHFYINEDWFETLTVSWHSDIKVQPGFRYEKHLSKETEQQIEHIEDKKAGKLTSKDKKFLRETLSSQALADYIIFHGKTGAKEPTKDFNDLKKTERSFKKNQKKLRKLKKKYPDYPLLIEATTDENQNLDQFTIETIFKGRKELSAFELEHYLIHKLNALVPAKDLTAQEVLSELIENVNVNEELRELIIGKLALTKTFTLIQKVLEEVQEDK